MEATNFPYPSQPKNNNKTILFVVVAVLIISALIGWFLIAQQPKQTDEKKDVVVEKKEPSPTEKPKIEKSSVKIQVLNGTGTPGQAGIVVKALEEAGYNSDNIKTSNAEKFDNSATIITARVNFEEIVSDVEQVLKPKFDKITVDSSALDENSEFDIVVVTGGKIFEEVTPTTTPSVTTTPALTSTPTPTPTP